MDDSPIIILLGMAVICGLAVGVPRLLRTFRARDRSDRPGVRPNPAVHQWKRVAGARGGFYGTGEDDGSDTDGFIEVDIGDALVRLELRSRVVSAAGKTGRTRSRTVYTSTAKALLPVPNGPTFYVRPEDQLTKVKKAFNKGDVTFGEEAFDEHFQVTASEPEHARLLWNAEAIGLMLRWFPECHIECDGRQITLKCAGVLTERDRIDAALDLVGELANADIYGLDALEQLPGARYVEPEGDWDHRSPPFFELDEAVPVTIGPVMIEGRAVTRVEAEDVVWDHQLRLEADADGRFDVEGLALPKGAEACLETVGPGTLIVEGDRVAFSWRELETDRRRLLAGVRLVAAFAVAPGHGAYR